MLADWFKKIKRIGNSGLIFKTIVLLTQFLCLSLLISFLFAFIYFVVLFPMFKLVVLYICMYIYICL